MEYILRASSSLGWMIGNTVIFTAIFHWLWIYKYPLTLKQWKAVEYVWVLLAFLSALGLVDESRRFQAEARIMGDKIAAESALDRLGAWYQSYADYSCEQSDNPAGIQQYCSEFRQAMSDFALLKDTSGAIPEIPVPLIKLPKGEFPNESKIHDERFEQYQQARRHYLDAKTSSERSMIQQSLIILAPLMFAIAIGLKLTKVTGEYLLTKKS